MVDLLARLAYLLEAVNSEAKDRDKITKPEPWPRPYEVARPSGDEDDA